MMKFKNVIKSVKKLVKDNASTGIVVVAVAGVAATVYFAVKETREEPVKEKEPESIPEKVGSFVSSHPKTLVSAAVTTGAVIGLYAFEEKQLASAAALIAAEYTRNQKLTKKIPEEERDKVNHQIVEEYLFAPDESTAIRTGHGNILCYDEGTGHFFYSCQNYLQSVALRMNMDAFEKKDDYIELDDFYREIGLPVNTKYGLCYAFEYNPEDGDSGIQLYFDAGKTPEGVPYLIMKYANDPVEL